MPFLYCSVMDKSTDRTPPVSLGTRRRLGQGADVGTSLHEVRPERCVGGLRRE